MSVEALWGDVFFLSCVFLVFYTLCHRDVSDLIWVNGVISSTIHLCVSLFIFNLKIAVNIL